MEGLLSAGLTQSSFGRHCLAIYNRFAVKNTQAAGADPCRCNSNPQTIKRKYQRTLKPRMYGKKVGTPKLSSMKTVKC